MLQITEYHKKSEVSENSKVVYEYLQNELHEKANYMCNL